MSISNILIENIQFMVQCQHSCTDETCINSHAIQLANSKHKYKRKHGSVLLSHKLLTKWPRSVKTYLRLRTSRGLRKVFFSDVLGTVLPESSFLSAFIEFILETLCQLYQKHNRGWHLWYFSLFFYFSSMPLQTYLSYHTVSYKLKAKSKFKSENKNALGFEAILIKIC